MTDPAGTEPSAYETRLRRLGDNLADMLDGLWAEHEAGRLTLAEFHDLGAIVVVTANGQAAALARLSVAAYITEQTGEELPALTAEPPPHRLDPARVQTALATITAGAAPIVAGRLSRLGHAEPVDAGAETFESFFETEQRDDVDGWTRKLEADACDLCRWWAANSHKFSARARMPRHNGCACTQLPNITTKRGRA